ncbi:MAG: hypothetical protein ACLP2X_14120, partial [Syntrophobacteraceae bacterium]
KKADSGGYKDTLIWESIKELLKRDKDIEENNYLFISKDQDFAHRSSEEERLVLHPELERDVKSARPASFKVLPDLKSFAKTHIEKGLVVREDKFKEFITEDGILLNLLNNPSAKNIQWAMRGDFRELYVHEVYVTSSGISSEYEMNDNQWLVFGDVEADVFVEAIIDEHDFDSMQDRWKFDVQDYEHAQYVLSTTTNVSLTIHIDILFDGNQSEFIPDSIEITDISAYEPE